MLLLELFEPSWLSLVSYCVEQFEDFSNLLPAQREFGKKNHLLPEFWAECLREFGRSLLEAQVAAIFCVNLNERFEPRRNLIP